MKTSILHPQYFVTRGSIPVILQDHFSFDGPFGDEMTKAMITSAESINHEPGLIWKIWTENADQQLASRIYLVGSRANAEAYCEMHTARLEVDRHQCYSPVHKHHPISNQLRAY
nr:MULTISPECIES: YdhR family protein [Halomonas]